MRRFLLIFLMIFILAGCEGGQFIGAPLSDAAAARALDFALSRIGSPYVYGGQGPNKFDCSGLVIWSYLQSFPNIKLHYGMQTVHDTTANGLWRYNVIQLQPEHIGPGDLIFISNKGSVVTHVGLFIRWVDDINFEFVHASASYGKVTKGTRSMKTQGGYWYVGAGRLKIWF